MPRLGVGSCQRVLMSGTGGPRPSSLPRTIARVVLGLSLLVAGIGHLTFGREEFNAQVPDWLPVADDLVVAIFPGNISQFVNQVDGFGLTSDRARAVRLAFQPLLVLWALWSTGAWRDRGTLRSMVGGRR